MSAVRKPTPVGALGEVRRKRLAADAAMVSTGSRIDRSKSSARARPPWMPASTG